MLEVNSQAPDFTALDQDEHTHSLSDYRGQKVLLYFYPKDNTPGCTKEACAIRDSHDDLTATGLKVFGVSTDSPKSHKGFAEKHSLPFTLLSDKDKELIKLYDVESDFGSARRISYLINEEGFIEKVYGKVKPAEHAQEVLTDVS